ncbi:hypothetical protein B0H66DRAFT_43366 [Apodospora peruviana]|uniref:Uncharacterized protein n=1 Tax=Apodospora peruviana TaxID=516989 RepID=A0AAE0MGE1_9PEZI|nr:hypothetical protein B0H66DRAFT_43366 [Apodospora peruviana]
MTTTPFPAEAALGSHDTSATHLPGEPRVPLDRTRVHAFLHRELATPFLDELYPWVLIFAARTGDNISSLHRQRLKGREIFVAEDPRLHMVWDKYKIYIKPLPACLLHHGVWEAFLSEEEPQLVAQEDGDNNNDDPKPPPPTNDNDNTTIPYHQPYYTSSSQTTEQTGKPTTFDRRIALGFLRSYGHLIQHPSDFKIACEVGLLPDFSEVVPITWTRWARFISHFQDIPDSAVSPRYHFGHLRLGRLDWAVRLRLLHRTFVQPFLGKRKEDGVTPASANNYWDGHKRTWYYLQPYWSIPVLLEGMFNYFLFAFATASLVLSAMQVMLAVPLQDLGWIPTTEDGTTSSQYVLGLWRFFWVFSNATIYVLAAVCLGMLVMLVYPYLTKFGAAMRTRRQPLRG